MRGEEFAPGAGFSINELNRRLEGIDSRCAELARAASLVGYWWSPMSNRIVPEVVARLANGLDRSAGVDAWLDLYLYPALLVLYANGLGAVIGHREAQLGSLLGSPTFRERGEWTPLVTGVNATTPVAHERAKQLPGFDRHHTPMSDRLEQVLAPLLSDLEPDPAAIERDFDRFEYLVGLVLFDTSRQIRGDDAWAPVGRFYWRRESGEAIEAGRVPDLLEKL